MFRPDFGLMATTDFPIVNRSTGRWVFSEHSFPFRVGDSGTLIHLDTVRHGLNTLFVIRLPLKREKLTPK